MYIRLFASIVHSSINVQSVPTEFRWLWIVMLVLADEAKTGVVDMPLERLAAAAGLTVEQAQRGIEFLSSPDPNSRSDAEEGRRIVPIREGTRGWQLVNWDEYRKMFRAIDQREQTRERVRKYRERKSGVAGNAAVTERNGKVTEKSCLEGTGTGTGKDEMSTTSLSADTAADVPVDLAEAVKFWNEHIAPKWGKPSVREARTLTKKYLSLAKHMRSEYPDWSLVEALKRALRCNGMSDKSWFRFRPFFFEHDYHAKNEKLWTGFYESFGKGGNYGPQQKTIKSYAS